MEAYYTQLCVANCLEILKNSNKKFGSQKKTKNLQKRVLRFTCLKLSFKVLS